MSHQCLNVSERVLHRIFRVNFLLQYAYKLHILNVSQKRCVSPQPPSKHPSSPPVSLALMQTIILTQLTKEHRTLAHYIGSQLLC